MPVVAAYPGGRGQRVGASAQGQGRELKAGRPAFRALPQRRGRGRVEVGLRDRRHHRGRFVLGEPKIVGPNLDELAAGAHPGER